MSRLIGRAIAAAFIGAALVAASAAHAQSPEQFYKGKTVYLYIGEAEGGGYDTWGRLVARHMKDHIPGNPSIVPQNVPGAGGLLALNQIANTAPKDGSTFAIVNRGMPFEPLLGGESTHFDPRKLNWIGSPELDVIVCTARKDAPVKTMQDLFSKELIIGATGTGADTLTYPEFLQGLLGMKFKIVKGFPGSSPIVAAIERNEVQGICNSYNSVANTAYYRDGHLNLLFQAALKADPRIKDVPVATDLAKTDSDRQALKLFLARAAIGRPFVAPAQVPADRVQALRTAFDETMKDPGFIADAKKARLNLGPLTGQELAQIIDEAYATPKDVVTRVEKAMGRNPK
jgi:tripartite-type tricarboxylate transporter receptor subunit TctC